MLSCSILPASGNLWFKDFLSWKDCKVPNGLIFMNSSVVEPICSLAPYNIGGKDFHS